jgi:hypothetical protein
VAVARARSPFADLVDRRECTGVEVLDARDGRNVARQDPIGVV